MGCCISSPHSQRRYNHPIDADNDGVPLRYFGTFRPGSNLVPDDIGGLSSTHLPQHLASDDKGLLYEAQIDHGKAFRSVRFAYLSLATPCSLPYLISSAGLTLCTACSCDEACCWLRKEYSTRSFFRVYSNRIEVNQPSMRCPFGPLGCGSWNADSILVHPFDRGAFGFQPVRCASWHYLCFLWPVFGGAVARNRCPCFGPLWNRMCTDCGGWWCDEWCCQLCFCTYKYNGLADAEETAFAASIALQAYFEGRSIAVDDMNQCLEFWRSNVSQRTNPTNRQHDVCCTPLGLPTPSGALCYKCTHMKRNIPYRDHRITREIKEVYERYDVERLQQMERYDTYYGPVQSSTVCQLCGCRRCIGRKGCCFCTEGCTDCTRKAGEPAPPSESHYWDDEWDASSILTTVLGPPPPNVVIRRWRWNPEAGINTLDESRGEAKAEPL